MRVIFQRYNNRRTTFTGTVIRAGTKRSDGYIKPTLLIRNVTDSTGRITADHIWMDITHDFFALWLQPGDIVRFDARVKPYKKGNGSIDYELNHQTKLIKIISTERETP